MRAAMEFAHTRQNEWTHLAIWRVPFSISKLREDASQSSKSSRDTPERNLRSNALNRSMLSHNMASPVTSAKNVGGGPGSQCKICCVLDKPDANKKEKGEKMSFDECLSNVYPRKSQATTPKYPKVFDVNDKSCNQYYSCSYFYGKSSIQY